MKKSRIQRKKTTGKEFLGHAEIKEMKEFILLSKLLGFRGFDEMDKGI